MMTDSPTLRRTPFYALHLAAGARMVGFAGYELPLNYADGIVAEHLHTRAGAGLFDVSHMGQIVMDGGGEAAAALEGLLPADLLGLAEGRQRYSLLTNPMGGVIDDLMVQRVGGRLVLVVNAAGKCADLEYLRARLPAGVGAELADGLALLALQGPAAVAALAAIGGGGAVEAMRFLAVREMTLAGVTCVVSRSGYSGEDGFELSLPADGAVAVARALLAQPAVKWVGLGARDSLRLEAGLCLYGQDLTATTTPVEAGLGFAIARARRRGGARAGGFPGDAVILSQLDGGAARRRVGLAVDGRAPVRAAAVLLDGAQQPVGEVTSGGFSPSLSRPICMGYVRAECAAPGTELLAVVRGKHLPVRVALMPFVADNFYRG